MLAEVRCEEELSFEQVREKKSWLTSSEARSYIKDNCVGIWSTIYRGWKRHRDRPYYPLYRLIKEGILEGKGGFDLGGRWTRFYSKESIDDLENLWREQSGYYDRQKLIRRKLILKEKFQEEVEKIEKMELELLKPIQDKIDNLDEDISRCATSIYFSGRTFENKYKNE
jgi:hypothetical protein